MMSNKKIVLVIAALGLAGMIWLIIWYSNTIPLRIEIDKQSTITSGLVVTTSKDGHKKIHKMPYRPRVKPGTYTITAWGNGAAVITETVTVERNKDNRISLKFREVTGEDFQRLYTGENTTNIPFLELFPYETIDYIITTENNESVITKINIQVKHRFTVPSNPTSYAEERRIVTELAIKWLRDNGIPESIPVSVTDI